MVALIITLFLFFLYLVFERLTLDRDLKTIPLRIIVTGTRGKSSVVRLLASILREQGKKVFAKTTGTVPRFILPDGTELEVRRNRLATILEQKKLIAKAAKARVDCVVAEIMSIQPENFYIESQRILQPQVVVLTNVRLDHTDAMGKTINEIADVLSLIIPPQADFFVLEKENKPVFAKTVKKMGGTLIQVKNGLASPLLEDNPALKNREFADSLDLVYGLAKRLHIADKIFLSGIAKTAPDVGKFKIWKYTLAKTKKTYYLVNGFAANDPESTYQLILKLKDTLPFQKDNLVGIMNLRADRGDRTMQWLAALTEERFGCLKKIFVCGAHKQVVKRKVARAIILKNQQPEKMMNAIFADLAQETVILGLGNFAGLGKQLVDFWEKAGERHGL